MASSYEDHVFLFNDFTVSDSTEVLFNWLQAFWKDTIQEANAILQKAGLALNIAVGIHMQEWYEEKEKEVKDVCTVIEEQRGP